jgi:hypothetical protein
MIEACEAKTPRDFRAASYSARLVESFRRIGIRGMKILRMIGSIPIYLLKEDLPKRAMSLTRSVKRSGMVFKRSPLLMRFLSI